MTKQSHIHLPNFSNSVLDSLGRVFYKYLRAFWKYYLDEDVKQRAAISVRFSFQWSFQSSTRTLLFSSCYQYAVFTSTRPVLLPLVSRKNFPTVCTLIYQRGESTHKTSRPSYPIRPRLEEVFQSRQTIYRLSSRFGTGLPLEALWSARCYVRGRGSFVGTTQASLGKG